MDYLPDVRHTDVARRTDPEQVVMFGAQPHEVAGLRVTLRLPPGGWYAIEARAFLTVEHPPEQVIELAPFLVQTGRRRHAPWTPLPQTIMEPYWVVHAFAGLRATTTPIDVGLVIKTRAGEARYDVGVLSALAIPEFPITVQPGLGLTLRLA